MLITQRPLLVSDFSVASWLVNGLRAVEKRRVWPNEFLENAFAFYTRRFRGNGENSATLCGTFFFIEMVVHSKFQP